MTNGHYRVNFLRGSLAFGLPRRLRTVITMAAISTLFMASVPVHQASR